MLSIVFLKRTFERPRRSLLVWGFDISKQCVGAGVIHVINLMFAIIMAESNSSVADDECIWYCISFIIDSTLGMTTDVLLLNGVEAVVLKAWPNLYYIQRGQYGEPPSWYAFSLQMTVWACITVVGKVFSCIVQVIFAKELVAFMNSVFHYIKQDPQIELFLVMILIPFTVNAIQFCIVDQFLKKSAFTAGLGRSKFSTVPAGDGGGHEEEGDDIENKAQASSTATSNNNDNSETDDDTTVRSPIESHGAPVSVRQPSPSSSSSSATARLGERIISPIHNFEIGNGEEVETKV